jgi:hypothetical protein
LVHLAVLAACTPHLKSMRMERMYANIGRLRASWELLTSTQAAFAAMKIYANAAVSSIHGVGLFASEPLEAGSLISFYPVDAIGDEHDYLTVGKENRRHFAGSEKERVKRSGCYRVGVNHPQVRQWAEDLWVDANPSQPATAGWLAHLVNDAATLQGMAGSDEAQAREMAAAVSAYYDTARRKANCVLVPIEDAAPLLGIVTTQHVDKGDELLVCYGHDFWIPAYQRTAAPEAAARARDEAARFFDERSVRAHAALQTRYSNEVELLESMLELDDRAMPSSAGPVPRARRQRG